MVVTMENAVFWDVTPCGSCKNRRFGGTYSLHHQGDQNRRARNNYVVVLRSVLRLPVIGNVAPSPLILVTLMMEAILSSETSVHRRPIRLNIPEDGIIYMLCSLFKATCGRVVVETLL
jgi:hypothetical protein